MSLLQLQQSSNWMLLLLITKFNLLHLYFTICLEHMKNQISRWFFTLLHANQQAPRALTIFTPDTDVLILALTYSPEFPANSFVNLLASNRCELHVHKLYDALGEDAYEDAYDM